MEVPLMVRDLLRLPPPETSIQALVIFVPGARMSTTMVISLFCSTATLVFMRGGTYERHNSSIRPQYRYLR